MRRSKMLAKIRNGELARVCAMGHFLPFFVRHAAHRGYDGIWLDLEHRAIDDREIQSLIAMCHYNDIDCMVRPATLQRSELYRYLEEGASGLMVPFVSDAETARFLVNAVKFPPAGNRGVDGAGLDSDYTIEAWKPGSTYFDDANRETFIVAQIETPQAVANIEEIAAVPGIDCLFIGPGDLGRRLAVEDTPNRRTVADIVPLVVDAARRNGKAWGITSGTKEDLLRYRRMGAQIIPWGSDFLLVRILENCGKDLEEAGAEKLESRG